MTITVNTKFNHDLIEQSVVSDTTEIISREIINLKDKGVRDALIALGWTPPCGKLVFSDGSDTIDESCGRDRR